MFRKCTLEEFSKNSSPLQSYRHFSKLLPSKPPQLSARTCAARYSHQRAKWAAFQNTSWLFWPKSKLLIIIMRWQVYRMARLVGKGVWFQHRGNHWWAAPPPLPKAAKPVWAKQLTRLPCLVVYVKFQFVFSCNWIVTRETVSSTCLCVVMTRKLS